MPDGCYLVPVPNTSQWQMVCTTTANVHAVPTLTPLGGLLLALALVWAAWRKM